MFGGTGNISFSPGSVKEIYPQWWGAEGNGSTDDQPAIQAAVNACPVGGKLVLVLPKIAYKIGTTIRIAKQIALEGLGSLGFKPTENSPYGVRIINSGTDDAIHVDSAGHVTIKNLRIEGNSLSGCGLHITGTHSGTYEDLYLGHPTSKTYGHGKSAICIDSASYFNAFHRIIIKNNLQNGIHLAGTVSSNVNAISFL
jgi:hypothetical protein